MLTIKTNNQKRDLIGGWMLSDKEKSEFDYIVDFDDAEFFRYKGQLYDVHEFMRIENNEELKGWHGYNNDTYFSGLVIKLYSESVIVGAYSC